MADESLDICRRHGSRWGEALVLYLLGDIAFDENRHDEAFDLLLRSRELARAVGFRWWEGGVLDHLAEYALRLGRTDEARDFIADGLRLATEIGDRQTTVWTLAYAAWLAALKLQAGRAGRLWGAIEAEEGRARVGQWEEQRDDYLGHLAAVNGPEFEAARVDGQRLPIEDAVDFALTGLEASG
jgi:hypothetical protein